MLITDHGENSWSLRAGEMPLLTHSTDRPFATAVRLKKSYTANRGIVKVRSEEKERIPLTAVSEDGSRLVFTGGGHALSVRIKECDGGAELDCSGEEGWAYEFRLPSIPGEAVFGGGEQYRHTNLRGEKVVNFVSEHVKTSTLLEKALLPAALYKEKPHSTIGSYAPMPVFMTDRGRLFYFETDADGSSYFGENEYLFSFDVCPKRLVLLTGPDYTELSLRLAERIPNRQYLPDWCGDGMIFGVQSGTKNVLDKTFALLDAGAKICAVWCQDWSGENRTVMGHQVWWNWEVKEDFYPDLRGAITKLRARGVRFLAYINPYLVKGGTIYKECKDRGYLITRMDGSIYHIKTTTFDAGMLDLTNPEAVRYIKDVLIKKNMLDLGISGWMADFGEYLPVDCVLHDGAPSRLHNRWPVLWAKINREALEEYGTGDEMFFSRSGYPGIQSYAPVLWNGDQHTDLTKDYGMPCVMPASFSLGFSGVPMIHCDTGGFFSFGKMHRDDELFIRWMEMCTFSLLMRSHESIRPWANSQPDSPGVLPYTVRLTNVHAALKPYLQHLWETASQGVPVMRPDFWEEMDFGKCRDEYSYFLGDDLFVCPVIERNAVARTVFLPKGKWIHLWSGAAYETGAHRVLSPLGEIPVFYRTDSPFAEIFRAAARHLRDGEA